MNGKIVFILCALLYPCLVGFIEEDDKWVADFQHVIGVEVGREVL